MNKMHTLKYTPDKDTKVHEEGAIRLLCRAFQSHEAGIPEWLKNSADAYSREDAPESKRAIVVIFDFGRRNQSPSISCLDLSGMTSPAIEENFRIWADPEAALRGSKTTAIQGGHGNGGKCYMTQMFENFSLIHTVKKNKGCCYGVESGSIKFGYIPDRDRGRDFSVSNLEAEIEKILTPVRCPTHLLPAAVKSAISVADGFSFITGVGPKGYANKIPFLHLVTILQEHPQMMRTLELCKVFVVVNGKLFNDGQPLELPNIKPIEGSDQPKVIPIPQLLKDPVSQEEVSTNHSGSLADGELMLRTSDVSMRYKRKGRHNVVYKAQSGYIGYTPVLELDVQSPYRNNIYGECYLEALEQFKQNERGPLSNSPLTRAVKKFISEQVELYAKEFEARERRRTDQEERNAISKLNEVLDRWKNRFLNELMHGLWGVGDTGTPPPPPPLPTGKPAKIEISLSHRRSGIGVSLRPTIKFFDNEGRRIRPIPYRWVSEDNNVAMVDEDLMVINTFSYGTTSIYAETLEGKIRSNKVSLEVVRIVEINILPSRLEIPAGSRQKLEAVCCLSNKEVINNVYLVWTESNPNVARVSSSGLVFGFSPGETKVAAGDDKCFSKEEAIIKVVAGTGRERGENRGQGYPLVLVSGEIDRDPNTNNYVYFSSEEPPVAQRPQDVERNIWWINSFSPLAKLYLDVNKGYGYQSREWRMYHLERFIDVIVQIALTQGPSEIESLSVNDWIMKWGSQVAEIQSAAVADLSEFINSGETNEG